VINTKIISTYKDLEILGRSKKKIGLCHGVFDIVHNGHIMHLKSAKKQVDKLVVSITDDEFVKKGPNQPINNSEKRLSFLSSIEFVDYVFINKTSTSEKVVKHLKPKIYFKGKDYLKGDFTNNLNKEKKIIKNFGGKTVFTNTEVMSSSKIINNNFSIWSNQQKNFLKGISQKYDHEYFVRLFEKLDKMEINLIGEVILDKYIFVSSQGLTSKDPAMSMLNEKSITIPGGVLAVAEVFSQFVNTVNLYTATNNSSLKYLKKNKKIKIFNLDEKRKTQIKSRFINENRSEKILQVTNFKNDEKPIIRFKEKIKKLKSKLKNNLVICDYGIGFFNGEFIKFLDSVKIKKFLNVQTNSLNLGFNQFTKYKEYHYLCLDRREWEIGLKNQKIDDKILFNFSNKNKKNLFTLTDGKFGSYLYSNKNKYYAPVFISKTIDTTGCGDAYFAITSLLILIGADKEIIPFLGNIYAGMHGQFYGNKAIVNKTSFLNYLKSVINF
jgi:rfaE bifunctional protein nucleotidyltransferase chain/domain|tara:strand:+ start:3725 stop:5209 length:1485 start_codon:yes stop_codon:yes gene_type:complete